jgi:rfaE bifunctional protein kinase chain/domain
VTKGEYSKLFETFNHFNVLIIGDVMVDSYLWGKVERISPEAPVPIVSVTKRENRLGGAANVALNIKSMGANPILCSVIGNDQKGVEFLEMLKAESLRTDGVVQSRNRITTTKFRVIGNKSQLLRVDEEMDKDLDDWEFDSLLKSFETIIHQTRIDVIIFQDYDKGVISELLIEKTVELARKKKIPVAVDPKKRNFGSYRNVTLFKPNLKELREGMKLDFDVKQKESLAGAVSQLKKLLNPEMVLVTLSEDGVYIDYKTDGEKNVLIIPSHVRSISDVSGAGDTVISVASLCLAAGCDPSEMARLANLAGGLVCEKVGVVPIDRQQLFMEAVKLGV